MSPRPNPVPSPAPDTAETASALYIANAGLVLLTPYLPRLFERLGLLTPGTHANPRMEGEAQWRGVHLLQYLVDGRCDRPAPELVLNKLLCGLPPEAAIAGAIEPSGGEREICEGLLTAVIGNWPTIKNTSIAGLRATFLQREGHLAADENGWALNVQRKTLDILVDQVPWSFHTIYHRWMPGPVHVTW